MQAVRSWSTCLPPIGVGGVILGIRNKAVNHEPAGTNVHSVSFVWLASMLLMVLWPSFVTALFEPEYIILGLSSTYLAMVGSILATYVLLWALKRTIDLLVFTYAILAGGGASVDLFSTWHTWLIGLLPVCMPIVFGHAGGTQGIAVVGPIVIPFVVGVVVGLVLRIMPKPARMLDDAEAFPAEEMRATHPA